MIVIILAIISLVGAVFFVWQYFQGYACNKWQTCTGIIVQSKISTAQYNKNYRTALIFYKYTVEGKEYYSRRLGMDASPIVKKEKAEELQETYPVDKQVTVRYHPFFHGFAVIETGPRQAYLHLLLFTIFLLVFCVSIMSILMPNFNPIYELIFYFGK